MAAAVFYLNDPAAPKPNRPAHLGVNILLEWDGKLLLERRRDDARGECDCWQTWSLSACLAAGGEA